MRIQRAAKSRVAIIINNSIPYDAIGEAALFRVRPMSAFKRAGKRGLAWQARLAAVLFPSKSVQ
jgi:hypothetical protein